MTMTPGTDPAQPTPSRLTRRTLAGRAAAAGGVAALLAMAGLPTLRGHAQNTGGADPSFEGDGIAVLNYALTLEHLETALYRDALAVFTADDFADGVYGFLEQIAAHEAAHVEALTGTITDLGGEPVAEATYDFGYTDAASFLAVAAAIEDVGVSAYAGAAPSVVALAPDLVPTALGIHSVEARHASYINALINDEDHQPFPDAVDAPRTPAEVLDIAGTFVDDPATGTPAATPATPGADASAVTVEMVDFGFEPAEITVRSGTTVTWVNRGVQPHNAAATDGSFATDYVTNGGSVSVTLGDPGTYPYVCDLHAGLMQGQITVTD